MVSTLPRLLIEGPQYLSPENIRVVEEVKNARYIGASSIPVRKPTEEDKARTPRDRFTREVASDFEWSYRPLSVFWQAVKHPDSGEHTFGLYLNDGKIMVRSTNMWSGIVTGVFIPSTNVLTYSTHRHDFYCPNDAVHDAPRVCIDGGRDYLRILGNSEDYECVTIDLVKRTFTFPNQTEEFPFDFPLSRHRNEG